MSKLRHFLLLAVLVGAFALMGASPVSAAEPEAEPDGEQAEQAGSDSLLTLPEITMDFLLPGEQVDVVVGEHARVSVYLIDPAGNPIEGAEITFTLDAEFMNVISAIELGTVVTDIAGLAEVKWEPRSAGENVVSVVFAGNDVFAALTVRDTLTVKPGGEQYNEAEPLRIPAASIWMVVVILGLTWGTYVLALGFALKIARAGNSS
jgi:hypothetical protein